MLETILGGIAFLLFAIYDLEQARIVPRRFHAIVQFFFLIGFLLLMVATVHAVWGAVDTVVCDLKLAGGLALALLFFILLLYTLFFALPFEETYVTQTGKRTYDKGMYALCRHPGVLWFAGFYFSLWFALGSAALLWIAILYSGLNVGYIILQDMVTFPRIFSDYEAYRQRVPFLLPTPASLKRCVLTLRKVGD